MRRIITSLTIASMLAVALCSCGFSGDRLPDPKDLGGSVSQTIDAPADRQTVEASSASDRNTSDADGPSADAATSGPGDSFPTLKSLLETALIPVGQTMYVWGGGWNEEDTGAGIEAVTLGVSPRWAEFAAEQTAAYDYKTTKYQIHDGLDCSGYLGWVLYNTLETEDGHEGYVMSSTKMAETLAGYGWGTLTQRGAANGTISGVTSGIADGVTNGTADGASGYELRPGDIVSMEGHVWISLGTCQDGSVLLVHASPPGVRIAGTLDAKGGETDAVRLAAKIMKANWPEWYEKYPACSAKNKYLSGTVMTWTILDTQAASASGQETTADAQAANASGQGASVGSQAPVLADPEGFQNMSAEEIAEKLDLF